MTQCIHSSEDLSAPSHSCEDVTTPQEWSCPHEAVEGFDRCIFHLEPSIREDAGVAESDIQKAAVDLLTDSSEPSELVGARLPELEVTDSVITGNPKDKIDIRFATIDGELKFNKTRIDLPLVAKGCIINKGFDFTGATFGSKVDFYGARFKGASESIGVHFRDTVVFSRVLSSYSFRLRDSTIFEQTAVFSNLTIKGSRGTLDLRQISANGPFYCRNIDVPRLNCREAIFRGIVGMNGSHIRGDALFRDAHFHALARFGKGDRTHSKDSTEIDGHIEFTSVLADQTVGFESVKFGDDIDLSGSYFDRSVKFVLVSLNGDINLHGATFTGNLVLKPQYAASESDYCTVCASETTLSSGTLAQAGHRSSDTIRYDIVDSTIGDVSFVTPEISGAPYDLDNYSYTKSDLSKTRFLRTKFDRFDFTSYREGLEGHWILHRFHSDRSKYETDSDPSSSDLELTYMYAKQGADTIGDNLAASKFFQHEMDRRIERQREKDKKTIAQRGQHLSLRLWRLVNYTESPLRVFGLGIVTTLIFSVLYLILSLSVRMNSPYPEAPLGIGYLIFSGESFISLVHPPGTPVTDWPMRFLSILEGFVGAFIIGLFVFSLTRVVHR